MLTRRRLIELACAAPVACRLQLGQAPLSPSRLRAEQQFSVMMWTLNRFGTFEANLEHVAEAGYHHVELVDEYKHWSPQDMQRIRARMQALGITVDAMAGMQHGFAQLNGADSFLAELATLIPIAADLHCGQIILLSGPQSPASTPLRATGVSDQQRAASIDTLRHAAGLLRPTGITGVIEPIDRLENPSIYLDGVVEAFSLTRAISSPHIKVLYDLYHEQRGLGNLTEKLENNIGEVALIHVADVPGRHQPGTGEVNFCHLYRTLARLSYTGILAMEFYPTGDVVTTLRAAREEALRCMAQP